MVSQLPTIENIIRELGDEISILDGGAGKGSFDYSEFPKARIVALDVVPVTGVIDPPNVERVTGDMGVLPFNDRAFDFVALNFVLEHTINPDAVLAEIDRVLKHEGVFYFSVPDCTALEDRMFRFAYKVTHPASFFHPLPGAHNQRFTVNGLKELVGRHGFSIAILVRYPGGFTWMPHWLRFPFLSACKAVGFNPGLKGNFIIKALRGDVAMEEINLGYVCSGCGTPRQVVEVAKGRWTCPRCSVVNIYFKPAE